MYRYPTVISNATPIRAPDNRPEPFMVIQSQGVVVYRARDHVKNRRWLAELERAADRLELGTDARSRATDLFLSTVSEWDDPDERDADSRRAVVAASLYAGSLIEGDQRSQGEIADAVGVARLTIQQRWKELLEEAGLEPPSW
jgi:transcription initiation factor TFIIIB Brf1 subunit/transcription initiation factor TFIIB